MKVDGEIVGARKGIISGAKWEGVANVVRVHHEHVWNLLVNITICFNKKQKYNINIFFRNYCWIRKNINVRRLACSGCYLITKEDHPTQMEVILYKGSACSRNRQRLIWGASSYVVVIVGVQLCLRRNGEWKLNLGWKQWNTWKRVTQECHLFRLGLGNSWEGRVCDHCDHLIQ